MTNDVLPRVVTIRHAEPEALIYFDVAARRGKLYAVEEGQGDA